MLKPSAFVLALFLAVASAQPPSPFISFGSSPPSSSSPFGHGPPGPPGPRPGPSGRPSYSSSGYSKRPTGGSGPSKLFSWIGSTMSKLGTGLVPKIQYHSPKSKPSGGSPFGSQNGGPPSYFSSSPPHESIILPQGPNSIFDGSSSPFGGSTVSFASNPSVQHSPVSFRGQGPPPSSFGSRPPPFSSRPPSFSSRPPPSFSSGGPPPSFSSGGPPPPSYSSGGPPPSYSSGGPPPPSYSSGGPPPPSYSSGGPPPNFGGPSSRPSFAASSPFASGGNAQFPPSSKPFASPPQNTRNNLEVFPSQQIAYQSQTLTQNDPGYDSMGGLQNLYGSQTANKQSQSQSYFGQQGAYSHSNIQMQDPSNYGATFHNIEPVNVAPMYDVANFKASQADLSGSTSQQANNIHDAPFTALLNQYTAHADASTSGSEQMMQALQGGDLATAASSAPIPGIQIMGQEGGNPVFEVVAGPNSPTYDGHPVDLSKLISMIEPGAEIDTIPAFGQSEQGAASEQQPMYVQAPSSLDLESEAAMSSGAQSVLTGNKKVLGTTQVHKSISKNDDDDDRYDGAASESRPAILKPDGSRLGKHDETEVTKHFDKELLDDLQGDTDKGFIIVRMSSDDETGDILVNGTLANGTQINNDHLLHIVQQLRRSNSHHLQSHLNTLEKPNIDETEDLPPEVANTTTPDQETRNTSTQHPNHNYDPRIPPDGSDDSKLAQGPVINPIFDSVRSSRVVTSESVRVEDDNDEMFLDDDDMIVETAGDLAASASRNVKSVAIIVTPPPSYVKIKNKIKKGRGPSSTLVASTTTPSITTIPSVDEAFNFSKPNRGNHGRNNRNSSSIPSSLSQADIDSLLKSISTTYVSNGTTPRYPVYKRKNEGA